jgi:hypothetical protein
MNLYYVESEGENVIGNSGGKEKEKIVSERQKQNKNDDNRSDGKGGAHESYNFIFPLKTEERNLSSGLIRGIWKKET